MSSVLGYTSDVDPDDLSDEELTATIEQVERDIEDAEEWERTYASEVDRLNDLLDDLNTVRGER